jgi:hypothetical protein
MRNFLLTKTNTAYEWGKHNATTRETGNWNLAIRQLATGNRQQGTGNNSPHRKVFRISKDVKFAIAVHQF